jgi:hypothetical protein
MHRLSRLVNPGLVLLLVGCGAPNHETLNSPTAPPIIEMSWGSLESPDDTGGFGMRVSLLADGQLSCDYRFTQTFKDFTGNTTSHGQVGPETLAWLERVFTDDRFLALPNEMPSGSLDLVPPEYQLATTFRGATKSIRLVPGNVGAAGDVDVLMKAVDDVFNLCPTRPLVPIRD